MQEPWQCIQDWIEGACVTSEIPADEMRPLAGSSQFSQDEGQRPVFRTIVELVVGLSADTALRAQDVAVAARENHRVASLHAHRRVWLIPQLRPALSLEHDVEANHMLEFGHDG